MNDDLVTDRLRRLGAEIDPPMVDPAHDVRRGRRRLRRGRALAAGGAVAVVVVMAGGADLLQGGDRDAADIAPSSAQPAVSSSASAAPPSVTPTPDGVRRVTPSAEPKTAGADPMSGVPGEAPARPGKDASLRLYRQVLIDHLDPAGDHIDKRVTNRQASSDGTVLTSLGTRLGWHVSGERGLGMVAVDVGAGWSSVDFSCASNPGWTCRHATAAGMRSAEVATYAGGMAVAVERPDRQVVVVTADDLFGNNSVTPLSGVDVTQKDLLAAAADPRLALPDKVTVPAALDTAAFRRAGLKALVGRGEAWHDATGVNDRGHYYASGRLSRHSHDVGALDVEADPEFTPPTGDVGCLKALYTRCLVRTVDGLDVFIRYQRPKLGDRIEVDYDGPAYRVLVTAPRSYPTARAVAFVTDARWQPRG